MGDMRFEKISIVRITQNIMVILNKKKNICDSDMINIILILKTKQNLMIISE